jgi:hypothetical protein
LIEKALNTGFGYLIEKEGATRGYAVDVLIKSEKGEHLGCGEVELVEKNLVFGPIDRFKTNVIYRKVAIMKIR